LYTKSGAYIQKGNDREQSCMGQVAKTGDVICG